MFNILNKESKINILCLGAHSDDIEIGCGGTILRILQEFDNICVKWIVFSALNDRKTEAVQSAKNFLNNVKKQNVIIKDYKENYFPFIGDKIKDYYDEIKYNFNPDIIFTHYKNDAHQDHKIISDITWNTFRNHMILEYEIPKYDGDFGSPNLFIKLPENVCQKKINYIMNNFKTQKRKNWFTDDTFWALLRLRGMEAKSPSKYAEAFYCKKIIF